MDGVCVTGTFAVERAINDLVVRDATAIDDEKEDVVVVGAREASGAGEK